MTMKTNRSRAALCVAVPLGQSPDVYAGITVFDVVSPIQTGLIVGLIGACLVVAVYSFRRLRHRSHVGSDNTGKVGLGDVGSPR